MLASPLLSVAVLATTTNAAVHELVVGTFGTNALYTLGFDDSTEELSLLKNTTTTAASSWIALSHDKKALYGTSFGADHPSFVSYSLTNGTDLIANNKILTMGGACANSTSPSIFAIASKEPPYAVYGMPFGSNVGCGSVMSVDSNGALDEVIQNYNYNSSSGVHGAAFSPTGSFYYSADDTGNQIWTHAVDVSTGELTLVAATAAPDTGDNPRHVAVSRSGKFLYVILEEANELAQFSLDEATGKPVYQNVSYPLIPTGSNTSLYWSDEVAISQSGSYLWATSRGHNSNLGYISAYSLDPITGAITKQLFLTQTTTSGGAANSVAPSEFSDTYVALTDSSIGFVEVWKFWAPTAKNATASASPVASVLLDDGGCCANAVWVS